MKFSLPKRDQSNRLLQSMYKTMPLRNFRELAVCLPWKLKSGRLQLSRSRDSKSEFYWHFLICVIYVYPYIYIYTHIYQTYSSQCHECLWWLSAQQHLVIKSMKSVSETNLPTYWYIWLHWSDWLVDWLVGWLIDWLIIDQPMVPSWLDKEDRVEGSLVTKKDTVLQIWESPL